jgi:tetratricopeptide (TPR) repeat protein
VRSAIGDVEGAEPLYREALAIRVKAYGEDHFSVAASRYYLARILAERGELREAEALMRTALERMSEEDPNRAALCIDLGELLLGQGRLAEAGPIVEDAVRLSALTQGEDHWRTGAARSARGAWHLARGRLDRAAEDLERAWAALEPRPEDDKRRQRTLDRLAALREIRGH